MGVVGQTGIDHVIEMHGGVGHTGVDHVVDDDAVASCDRSDEVHAANDSSLLPLLDNHRHRCVLAEVDEPILPHHHLALHPAKLLASTQASATQHSLAQHSTA